MVRVLPPTRGQSKFSGKQQDLTLPEDYDSFLIQYPQSILVAFGTTWQPPVEGIQNFVEAAKRMPQFGFIVSLQEGWPAYPVVKEANLPNILLRKFVPQVELLNDQRLFAFISHGGGNSILESIYYGKVLIGFPLEGDQIGTCFRVERLGLGISLQTKKPEPEEIISAINKVRPSENDNSFQKSIRKAQRMLEFRELRSGQDMAYYLRAVTRFKEYGGKDSLHLTNRSVIENSFISVYDYDLKGYSVGLVCLSLVWLANWIKR